VAGIKPTFGRVSRRGVFPLSWSLDHIGPLARTVRDAALVLQAIAGHDPADASSSREVVPDLTRDIEGGVAGARIGIPDSFFFDNLDGEVAAAVGEAIAQLEGLGAVVVPLALPYIEEIPPALTCIMLPEALAVHHRWMQERPGDYSESVRYRLELGAMFSAVHYVEAQRLRDAAVSAWDDDVFSRVDFVVAPATPIAAPQIDSSDLSSTMSLIRFTNPFNFLGVPAISIPCGFTGDGLPLGLQIVGRWWDEAGVFRAAYAYEQATGWRERRPPV
jgi:aspartyl-tRNA(Asn)/glutamyl-tRNA(Gln) amidotransferase subunit A